MRRQRGYEAAQNRSSLKISGRRTWQMARILPAQKFNSFIQFNESAPPGIPYTLPIFNLMIYSPPPIFARVAGSFIPPLKHTS